MALTGYKPHVDNKVNLGYTATPRENLLNRPNSGVYYGVVNNLISGESVPQDTTHTG